jgi:Domain of unknown function (DUF5710)
MIPTDWKLVRGNCYPVREELKDLGARWDRETQSWYVAPERLREAEALVEDQRARGRR